MKLQKNGKYNINTINEHDSKYLLPKFYKFSDIDFKEKKDMIEVINLCVPSLNDIVEYEHPYLVEKPYIDGLNKF